jgi:Fe/S biogenesis protein NfuA
LKDSEVALKEEGSSKKLTITAPNAKGEVPKDDAPLAEKIKYTIAAEVNPQLASHGGFVDLVEITDDMDVVLNFGGGCQGCSSVKVTLKNGVEAQLKSIYPEIKNILDVTDHSQKENAYM